MRRKILNALMVIIIFISIILVGCNDYGNAQESVQSGDFKVELLFEKDGCKVYRFFDNQHAVYWSDCSGKMSEQHWHQTSKNTGHTDHMDSITN